MPEPTDFHTDADVFSGDGHKLGSLKGVVLRRGDLSVTKVIVDVGFLRSGHALWEGGYGLEYDRVVSAQAIVAATEDRVELSLTAAEFKDAPEYTEEMYEAPVDVSPNEFDISDVVTRSQTLASALSSTPSGWLV